MKKIRLMFLTFSALQFVVSCGQREAIDNEYQWSPTRHDFDSLTLALDHRHMSRDHDWEEQLDMMDSIAEIDRKLPMKWRVLFFRTIWGVAGGDNGGRQPLELLKGAMEMCDSARYPYDYSRMRDVMVNIDDDVPKIEKYRTWSRLYDMASREKMTEWSANLLNQMANIEQESGLNETAYEHYEKSRLLFNKCGNTLFSNYIALNQANALRSMGQHGKADSLYRMLLSDRRTLPDTGMRVLININSYLNNNDVNHLKTAYTLVKQRYTRMIYLPTIYTQLARHSRDTGDMEQAVSWIDKALAIRDSVNNIKDLAEIEHWYIEIYGRLGRIENPIAEHELYVQLKDSADRVSSIDKVESIVMATRIKEYKSQIEQNRRI